MFRPPWTFLLVIAAIRFVGSGALASDEFEIFTCRDEHGNVSMQNDPCPEVAEKTVAPDKPASASGAVAKSSKPEMTQPRARPNSNPKAKPGPNARPRPKARPQAKPELERMQQSPGRSTSWIRLPATRSTTPKHRVGRQSFPTRLDPTAAPRPSYASPEKTWRTFLAAIEAGDPTRALSCLTADALDALGPDAASFPLDEIRTMIGTLVRIEDEGSIGPFWSIYGMREGRQPKWIFFEQVEAGWKIAGI